MRQIASFALLWFLAGYIPALITEQFISLPLELFQFGLVGLLGGLILLVPIIRTQRGHRLFFHGPAQDEDGDLWIGCLWVMPFVVTVISALAWLSLILNLWLKI